MIPLRSMAWAVLPLAVVLGGAGAAAQTGAQAQIRFTYENPKLQPHKYVLTVEEDGSGHFRSEGAAAQLTARACRQSPGSADPHLQSASRRHVCRRAQEQTLRHLPAMTGAKNIAFQGTKTLEYEGPEGQGSCMYNWSKNAQIDKLTDQFEAMAATLDEGSKLQRAI